MDSPETYFVVGLLTTVALLGFVAWTGFRKKRAWHLTLVVSAVASLGITIYFAEKLGEVYDIRAAGVITPIHLTLAKITTVGYLAPITTGILTWRKARVRKAHRISAFAILALTALTACTGTAMILMSERLVS